MQVLFYIGLFSTFFIVMSSITVGVSMSTMQQMVDQRANVEKMFRDVDFAINRIILRDSPSLEAYLLGDVSIDNVDDVQFTAENVSWSPQQLENDPWGSDIEVIHIHDPAPLGADAVADVNYFILASAGLNRTMDTDLSGINTSADWRSFRATGASEDDIIHTFSTKDALTDNWNKSSETERRIIEKAKRVYGRKVEQFNSNNNNDLNKVTTCALFGVIDNAGLDDIPCAPYTAGLITECHQVNEGTPPASLTYLPDADVGLNDCWRYDPYLRGKSDFPAMPGNMDLHNDPTTPGVAEALGIDVYLQNDPFVTPMRPGGSIVFEESADHPHQLKLQRDSDNLPGWDLSGREIIIEPK
mgnify:CR=1 FL=1